MPNPQIQQGATAAVPVLGVYVPGTHGWDGQHPLNYNVQGQAGPSISNGGNSFSWVVDKDTSSTQAYFVALGSQNAPQGGWLVTGNDTSSAAPTTFAVTVPAGAVIAAKYAAYYYDTHNSTWYYGLFDVVPVPLPTGFVMSVVI